ncbi:MAG: M6 family metalloprotease domain-containing protein [Bacteroidaceae bacterium]|nr:M6 family metalloprotease domain-containing protein [Bacteroidaceae bacterium]
MKHLLIALVASLSATIVMAVPAERVRRQVTLTDGSTLIINLSGDENLSWWQTDDGQIAVPAADGVHYELTGELVSDLQARAESDAQRRLAPRLIGSQSAAPLPSVGSPKVPVVLVNFTDSVFNVADTDEEVRQYYDLYCNGTRDGNLYQGHGSYGSIRDYFFDQSNGLFTPEFVIIGPVNLDHPESYYGSNGSDGKDKGYTQFRNDAITKATETYDGEWSDFDNRNKGQVDMVFFIYAGCGEANGGHSTTLWPRESTTSVTINGIKFATSACCNAMRARRNAQGVVYDAVPDGVGIMCHELSHALGLPDFYNTNYKSFGMDLWSLMDYGCYGSNGYVPCAYTAYERDFMGWQALEEITTTQELQIAPIANGGKGYKIVNSENSNEYYVIENRQAVGWDRSICGFGHGLQVTHVDFDASIWNGNRVNNVVNHQRMTIIAANNLYKGTYNTNNTADILMETWAGNLYPFGENNSLTSTTTPAATVYTASGYMDKELLDITENDDKTVSLTVKCSIGTGISSAQNGFTGLSDGETLYDLQGRRVASGSLRRGLYVAGGRKVSVR